MNALDEAQAYVRDAMCSTSGPDCEHAWPCMPVIEKRSVVDFPAVREKPLHLPAAAAAAVRDRLAPLVNRSHCNMSRNNKSFAPQVPHVQALDDADLKDGSDRELEEAALPPVLSRPSSSSSLASSCPSNPRFCSASLDSELEPAHAKSALDYLDCFWLAVLDAGVRPGARLPSSSGSAVAAGSGAPRGLSSSISRGISVLRSISTGLHVHPRRNTALSPLPDDAPRRLNTSFTYEAYEVFHMAVHRALAFPGTEWTLRDGQELARTNFAIDANGADSLPRAAFEDSLRRIARTWSEKLVQGNPELATVIRLLAAEARLPADLETIFLASLARLIVRPNPAGAGSIRPWHEVNIGCALARGVISLLYLQVYGQSYEFDSAGAHGHGRERSVQGEHALDSLRPPAPAARPRVRSLSDLDRDSSMSLWRRALHNRMERLLAVERQRR